MMRPDDQALKRAAGRLVAAIGGQEACPGFSRIRRHQSFSDYANVARPEAMMPIDVVRDLEVVTQGAPGAPHVTRELARQSGYALMRLPSAKPDGRAWSEHLATCAKEANDVICALASALGQTGPRGRAATFTRGQIAEAIAALVDLDAALAAVEDTS